MATESALGNDILDNTIDTTYMTLANASGTEVTDRVQISLTAGSGGAAASDTDLTFTGNATDTGVTWEIWDAASSGNLLMTTPTAERNGIPTVNAVTIVMASGDLEIEFF